MSAVILGESFPEDYYSNWTRDYFASSLMVIKPDKNIVKELCKHFENVKNINGCIGDQEILWSYFNNWPKQRNLHLSERYTVCYEHLEYYFKNMKYKVFKNGDEKNIAAIHFVAPKPWLLSKKVRYKYLIYNLIKCKFNIFNIFRKYSKILNDIE